MALLSSYRIFLTWSTELILFLLKFADYTISTNFCFSIKIPIRVKLPNFNIKQLLHHATPIRIIKKFHEKMTALDLTEISREKILCRDWDSNLLNHVFLPRDLLPSQQGYASLWSITLPLDITLRDLATTAKATVSVNSYLIQSLFVQ